MARFTGTFEGKVDDKGRASLPSDFRDVLKKQDEVNFYVFPSPNLDCLEACDDSFMQRVEESIEEQADMFSEEEDGLTYIASEARRVSFDSTGRFVLPAEFRDYADIDGRAAFVGVFQRFQIWNPENYAERAPVKKQRAKGMTLKLKPRSTRIKGDNS